MTVTIQCSLPVMMHVCGCVTDNSSGTYYGNSDVINVLEQLKLNLNYITCFECTTPDVPVFNILSELFESTKFIAAEGEKGFKILFERNAKFMNTHLTSQLDLCEIIIHYLMLKHS